MEFSRGTATKVAIVFCLVAVWHTALTQRAQGPRRTAPKQILEECYLNMSVFNRYNRMAMNVENLIGIIRKIEDQKMNWDIQRTAQVLLKRFRFDGIYINPGYSYDTNIISTIKYIEETVNRQELTWYLGPDAVAEEFDEDLLTPLEKCTLHFMLSHSLNDTLRDNEDDRDGEDLKFIGKRKKRDTGFASLLFGSSDDVPSSAEELVKASEDEKPQLSSLSQRNQNIGRQGDPTYELSQYPLEMGVMHTSSGTVAAGSVLAGIALGLAEETVQVGDLIRELRGEADDLIDYPTASSAVIINYFAGTLIGDFVVTALEVENIPNQLVIQVGGKGTWNSSVYPTEYSLETMKDNLGHLTHAQIFGGIDGLIMGLKIKEWDQGSNVRLSQILESYYSDKGVQLNRPEGGGEEGEGGSTYTRVKYRGCDRFNLIQDEGIISKEDIKNQAYSLGYAYHAAFSTIAGDWEVDLQQKIDRTLDLLWGVIGNQGDMESYQQCPYHSGKEQDIPVEPHVDLYLLVDTDASSSDLVGAAYLLTSVFLDLPIDTYGTARVALNMTMGGQWTQVLDLGEETNKMMIAHKMMREDRFWGYSNNLDMLETMSQLRRHFEKEWEEETRENEGGSNAKVVLFVLPKERPDEDEDDLEDIFEDFHDDFPDVHILFMANSQDWKEYASDPDRDFFRSQSSLQDFKQKFQERLEEIPDRLYFQRCKESRDYEGGSEYEGKLTPGLRRRMAYDDHWFFDSDDLEVTIRLQDNGYELRACMYRDIEDIDDLNEQDCKETGSGMDELEFDIRECGNCDPLYFHIDLIGEPTGQALCTPDSENICRHPESVDFTVSHRNMRCNGANGLAAFSPLLLLALHALRQWLS